MIIGLVHVIIVTVMFVTYLILCTVRSLCVTVKINRVLSYLILHRYGTDISISAIGYRTNHHQGYAEHASSQWWMNIEYSGNSWPSLACTLLQRVSTQNIKHLKHVILPGRPTCSSNRHSSSGIFEPCASSLAVYCICITCVSKESGY